MTKSFTHECVVHPEMWSDGVCGDWSASAAEQALDLLEAKFPSVEFVRCRGTALKSVVVLPLDDERFEAAAEAELLRDQIDHWSTEFLNAATAE